MAETTIKGTDGKTSSRGRPRSRDADRRILEAAFRMLTNDGYASMSIEAVAAEAGVAKTTIYRRYPTKRELAAAAMLEMTVIVPPSPPTDARTALVGLLLQGREAMIGQRALTMVGTLLVEERRDPELMRVFRERILLPRRRLFREVIERAKTTGEFRADLDAEMLLDLLVGGLLGRYLTGETVTPASIEQMVDMLWPSLVP